MPRPKIRLGILSSGRGSNLQAILDASASSKIDAVVRVVVSDKEGSDALRRARGGGVEAVHLDPKNYSSREDFDAAVSAVLTARRVDLVVLAGYMRLITSKLIEPFRGRIMNIHPSLLPAFPGLAAQRQALEWGSRIAGCTVHLVDETTDQGPIIIQAAVPVRGDDSAETLEARILAQEHRILPQAIQFFAEGRLVLEGRRLVIKSSKNAVERDIISPVLEIPL